MLGKLGTPPSENICFPHRQDRRGPRVSAGSHSSEREPFPCPQAMTPTFITPKPPLLPLRPPRALGAEAWTSPSPLPPCPHVVLRQCGHFTAERTAPVLLSLHHGLSRGRRRGEEMREARAEGEAGWRHLRCSHKAATVGTLTEASVIPCLHAHTCCPRARLFLSSSLCLRSLLPLGAVLALL